VVLTFNDRYWALAYTVMRSVCLTTTRRRDVVFHLCHTALRPDHAATLETIADEFGARLRHCDPDADPAFREVVGELPATLRFPRIVYARLLLDRLLPPEVSRVLYLDSDLYVRAPVENLIGIDLGGRSLAAAPEPGRHHLVAGDDMRTRKGPFDIADPYFNSGVLVIDRAAWGRADLPGFLAELQRDNRISQLYHDQDVLNLRFRGDWLALDPRWNFTKPHPAARAFDPFIVHYTTGMKPWNALAYVAFGSSYKHVMTRDIVRRYARYRRAIWVKRLLGRG
jgi:lipopolysaccharide biosynthesis glycosyltransferase